MNYCLLSVTDGFWYSLSAKSQEQAENEVREMGGKYQHAGSNAGSWHVGRGYYTLEVVDDIDDLNAEEKIRFSRDL